MKRQKLASAVLLVAGCTWISWLLYNASIVQRVLGLEGVASEAVVAVAGLVLASAALVSGAILWRTGSRPSHERPAL